MSFVQDKNAANHFQDVPSFVGFLPKLIMQILPTIQEETIEWCSEKWLFNQLSSEQTIYCQILHTVWYISGERLKEKIEVDHSWQWRVNPQQQCIRKSRQKQISSANVLQWSHSLIVLVNALVLQCKWVWNKFGTGSWCSHVSHLHCRSRCLDLFL